MTTITSNVKNPTSRPRRTVQSLFPLPPAQGGTPVPGGRFGQRVALLCEGCRVWADTGNVAVFINLMDSPLTLCPRTLRAAPCPAPGPALGGGGAAVAAAAAASASHRRYRCRRCAVQPPGPVLTSPDQGTLRRHPHSFLGSGTPSRAWGEAPFAGYREGGAWNRSQRQPSPD